jgi:hypothetical protein
MVFRIKSPDPEEDMRPGLVALAIALAPLLYTAPAGAETDCDCVSVAADVRAEVRATVARADNLYAAGEIAAALSLYAEAHAESKDAALLYAMAMCERRLGNAAEARARLEAYLATGSAGSLKYGARARGALGSVGGSLAGTAGGAVDLAGDVAGSAGAGAAAGVGAGGDLAGSLDKQAKPPKVAKGAAIVLAVVAVAAVGAVGIQSITAGIKDDVEFDTKFNLSLGLSGAVVGGTAVYLWGLTAATGAAACPSLARQTTVTPVAHRGGAGVAATVPF